MTAVFHSGSCFARCSGISHLVSRPRLTNKGPRTLFCSSCQRYGADFISITPRGNGDLYHCPAPETPTHYSTTPRAKVKWYVSIFFLWYGLRVGPPPNTPSRSLPLQRHPSDTKLLHTASPCLPLALSILPAFSLTYPGAIGDGNDLCIFRIAPPTPPLRSVLRQTCSLHYSGVNAPSNIRTLGRWLRLRTFQDLSRYLR